jgi:hypothetical protein
VGYKNYEQYRDWLRDEFCFRCVYCLNRERWCLRRGSFHIDHFSPQAIDTRKLLEYDNLVYGCATCNLAKKKAVIPNPEIALVSPVVSVREDGTIQGLTPESQRIIRKLKLDSADYNEFRMLFIGIVQMAAKFDTDLFLSLMGYPDDLPDLAAKRPRSNSKPHGVRQSCFARRGRNELSSTY